MKKPSGREQVHVVGSVGDEGEGERDALGWQLHSGGDDGVGCVSEIHGEFDDAAQTPELVCVGTWVMFGRCCEMDGRIGRWQ